MTSILAKNLPVDVEWVLKNKGMPQGRREHDEVEFVYYGCQTNKILYCA